MKRLILLPALLTLVALTACTPPTPRSVVVTAPPEYIEVTQEVMMATAAEGFGGGGEFQTFGGGDAGGGIAESPALNATAAPTSAGASDTSPLSFAPSGSRMVIKDATLDLLVSDTDVALARVTQLTADVNGYIISSQSWLQDGYRFASLRLGIPSAEFERVLNTLRLLALQVRREDASGQDVSAEYVDLQSRLTNLEATTARVREFLQDAKTVEESLRISQQLAELEGQIEQVKGQMRFYEGRAAFSTVTVQLIPQYPTPTPTLTPTPTTTPTPTPTLTPTPAWNPGTTFTRASGVLADMTQFTVDLLIWLVVVGGPFVLILGALVFVLRRVWRGRK